MDASIHQDIKNVKYLSIYPVERIVFVKENHIKEALIKLIAPLSPKILINRNHRKSNYIKIKLKNILKSSKKITNLFHYRQQQHQLQQQQILTILTTI
jgi:translation elongation factor EF-Ts